MGTTQAIALREDQAVVTRGNQITDVQRLGGLLAASGYFADAREMAQAAVKVLAGEELGIPPVAAMMGINIIKGKVALSGNLIASRIRAHGYEYRHKQFDAKGCVLEFLSKPDASGKRTVMGDSSFTEEDAKAAQCYSDMYKKFPRNMYFNRAISNGAKWYTPEVFAGAPVYVPEELGAKIDEQGDYIYEEAAPAPAPKPDPRAAQKSVAERKIAEMQAGKSYQDISAPDQRLEQPEPAAPEVSEGPRMLTISQFRQAGKFEKLQAFAAFKSAIGDEAYYRILGTHGCTHSNEFTTVGAAVMAYSEMVAEYQSQAAARGVA